MSAMIALRIVHIGLGVFWAGGVLFMNFIVGPALGASGEAGIKVMQELNRRRYFEKILAVGFVTILAGIDLMRRDSGGFASSWFQSRLGIGISAGMLAAIIGFLMGAFLIRPAMKRMAALGAEMAAAAPEARAAFTPRVDAARARLIAFGSVASVFMILAVVAMAVARYL